MEFNKNKNCWELLISPWILCAWDWGVGGGFMFMCLLIFFK
jgi:hypothetical protein